MRLQTAVLAIALACGIGHGAFTWSQETAPGDQEPTSGGPAEVVPPSIDVEALEASWASLTAREFMIAVGSSIDTAPDRGTRTRIQRARAREAARRLTETDDVTSADLESLHALVSWGSSSLDEEGHTIVQTKLGQRTDPAAAQMSINDLYYKYHTLAKTIGGGNILMLDWINGNDLSLVSVPDLEWLCTTLSQSRASNNRELWVTWTGSIRAPRNGQYVLSTSPLNVNLESRDAYYHTTTKIMVDGQVVLDTNAGSPVGNPITLSADHASELRIEFHHDHGGRSAWKLHFQHPPIAMLYWQGEGLQKQLVPASALSPPQGTEGATEGLLGEYKFRLPRQEELITNTIVDPQIDFVWTTGHAFTKNEPPVVAATNKVVAQVVTRYCTQSYMQARSSQLQERQFKKLPDWLRMSELMTSAQRKQVLQAWSGSEGLLWEMSEAQMINTYLMFRAGAEKEAVDFLGKWMQHQAPAEPRFAADFVTSNRKRLLELGSEFLTFEYPAGRQQMEEGYLEYPDGKCCLYAAYTLAYAYAYAGQLDAWIEKLTARLNNESLVGEKRVDWLIARAHAEEIRGSKPEPYKMLQERPLAGWVWLDEASLYAKEEATALRVVLEKLTRLASVDPKGKAMDLLAQARDKYTSTDAEQLLADYEEDILDAAEEFDAAPARQAEAAIAAHYAELERRMEEAAATEDYETAGRYQEKIELYQAQQEQAQEAAASEGTSQ
jgi:hypothetical protein